MNQLLPLLPSGPGGVHNLSLRGDRQEIPSSIVAQPMANAAAHYLENTRHNQAVLQPQYVLTSLVESPLDQGNARATSFASPPPPTANAMNCLPLTMYVIGVPWGRSGISTSAITAPLALSNARTRFRSPSR
jgi:hypothetical protein